MPKRPSIEDRLRTDTPYWASACVEIVNESGVAVPFEYRPAQLKVWEAIKRQQDEGKPVRVIVLKSRRTGISRSLMATVIHRCTTRANRSALVVAHTKDTAGELFDDAERFYTGLPGPDDGAPEWIKPPLMSHRNTEGNKLMWWGNPSKNARQAGDRGVDSHLKIDTASEVEAGRGKTIRDLLCSEVAFWPDPKKALSLMNAVVDTPDTWVVFESSANGHNFFKQRWDRAVAGESAFVPVFISWLEDPNCYLQFADADERERFAASVGQGEWGEDEPALVERGATLEQLAWRRRAIVDKCDGKLDQFRQEYPSYPEEAFVASGKHVFSMSFVRRAVEIAEQTDPLAVEGVLKETGTRTRQLMSGTLEVPTGAMWVPREATGFGHGHDYWRVWALPCGCPAAGGCTCDAPEPRQHVIGIDVADGEENTSGEGAQHAIEVIDHLTGEQVAEYVSRIDADELAVQACLAGLYFNRALVAVETTGSHGLPVAKWLHRAGYFPLHRRRSVESTREREQDRIGWDTNRKTKPLIIAGLTQLLREGTHGIRSKPLALEFTTYVVKSNGKQGPDEDAHADRLMAYGIAQQVRLEAPARKVGGSPPPTMGGRRGPQRPGW